MKKSIFLKVFGGYILLLLLLSAVFLLFSFNTIKRHYMDTLAHDLENVGRTLDARIFEYLDSDRLAELEGFLQEHGMRIGARLTVISPEGMVKADSERDPSAMEGHRFRPEISDALAGRVGRSIRFSSTLKTQMLYVALPLDRNGRIEGVKSWPPSSAWESAYLPERTCWELFRSRIKWERMPWSSRSSRTITRNISARN